MPSVGAQRETRFLLGDTPLPADAHRAGSCGEPPHGGAIPGNGPYRGRAITGHNQLAT